MSAEPTYDDILRMLAAHCVWGFNTEQTACWCDQGWRPHEQYRRHLADALMVSTLWRPDAVGPVCGLCWVPFTPDGEPDRLAQQGREVVVCGNCSRLEGDVDA
jgi:hypothetical protein